eukprot:scaffold2429_cov165-Amphora_coffeaeformis.AAC.9
MGLCGNDPVKAPGCLPTFWSEINPCQTWYSAVDKVTKRVIDIPATFAPTGLHVVSVKFLLTAGAFGILAYCFLKTDDKLYFFSKFTYIALILQCMYHFMSFFNSMCPTLRQPEEEAPVRGRAKLTWWLFNMSLHASIFAAILFWAMDFEKGDKVSLVKIIPHGPTVFLVVLDGLWVNRIPIRLFHWWSSVLPLNLAYTTWTILHAYLNIGNPTTSDTDPDTNDDAIYSKIVWKDDFVDTLVLVIIMILVVGPVLQFFLFLFSLYAWPLCCMTDRRRYTTSAATFAEQQSLEHKSTASQSNAEEGSIFASWG